MKYLLKAAALALLSTAIIFSSCEKKKVIMPYISFRTDSSIFVYSNTFATIQDTQFAVGLRAYKGDKSDILTKFYINVAYDDSSAYHQLFSEDLATYTDTFKKIWTIATRRQNGKERYNFVIENKDGQKNSITMTVNVKNP